MPKTQLDEIGTIDDTLVHLDCGGGRLEVTGQCVIGWVDLEEYKCLKCGARDLDASDYDSVGPRGKIRRVS